MARYRTKQLILFDIDGTLIHPGTIARKLLDSMVEEVSGASPKLKVEDVAGFTDPIILETALRRTNFSDGELSSMVSTLLEQYPAKLEERSGHLRRCRGAGKSVPRGGVAGRFTFGEHQACCGDKTEAVWTVGHV